MRQFYEACRGNKKVSALLRQLPWTHFYILAAIRERWSSRELERQIQSGAILRNDLSATKVSSAITRTHPSTVDELKKRLHLEFLSLPSDHSEADLHALLTEPRMPHFPGIA